MPGPTPFLRMLDLQRATTPLAVLVVLLLGQRQQVNSESPSSSGPLKVPRSEKLPLRSSSSCWKTCKAFSWRSVLQYDYCRDHQKEKKASHVKKKKKEDVDDRGNGRRCYEAYHTMIEHRDWSRTWEGPPEPSSTAPYVNHTMREFNAPECATCQLQFYTPANIKNMLCNIHSRLGERPHLVFQGSSVTRGQMEDFIRYLGGGDHDMHFANSGRHGPWVLEAPHCVIYYFFTGGLYSEADPAGRRVPLTHDVSSVERLLDLSTGKERAQVRVHQNNESNHETGSSSAAYEFGLNNPPATILVEFGPSVWDNCYLPATHRDEITANHSTNLIRIMARNRNNLAPGAQLLFRTIPKISAGSKWCHGKGKVVNEAIYKTANEVGGVVDVMPFAEITVKNKFGSVDGIHWHCTDGSPRNTKYNTTNATDGSSLKCYQMPQRSEVSLASAFYVADAIRAYGGPQSMTAKCPLPSYHEATQWKVMASEHQVLVE